ncbi:MAG: GAP family protein [Actinomycetota bacterium]
MGQAIGEFLPMAVGVAISPVPIIAVILMLFTDRARRDSLAFLLGWIVAMALALVVLIALASTRELGAGGDPTDTVSWIKLILGVLLILLAVKEWRRRPAPGTEATMPAWMERIDSMKPVAALGLALVLSLVNPKNLLLIAGGAIAIAQSDLSSSETAVAILTFTVIGAIGVATPTLGYLFKGSDVQPTLDRAKAWLAANNTAVMAVIVLVIGVSLFGKGLGALI